MSIEEFVSKALERAPRAIPLFLVLTLVGGFLGLMFVLLFHPIPAGNDKAIWFIAGQLSTNVVAFVQYYFGSSAQSKAKDEALREIAGQVKS